MKTLFKIFTAGVILVLAGRLYAQTNGPVRLALIAETDDASTTSDVLTAKLSGNPNLQLLERNDIEKAYREQGLSAANRDYLKLGQVLGADGLLFLDVIRTRSATNLTVRLVAVRPGVIVLHEDYPWPLKNLAEWAPEFGNHLVPFLPKLTLAAREAIPLSVVNLRSAMPSAEAQETERQLRLLTVQRLSRERQFFVLERQRMQLLGEEKEWKSDASPFWNGSYLLEGVVDPSGYSKDTLTIDVRLTPPRGGAPLRFEVSGSRTNFAEAVNRLAAKVIELLKVSPTVTEWNAADEAQQYFAEAKWALKWGIYPEAQAAAESAWALGKRNLECAVDRITGYVSEVSATVAGYQKGQCTLSPGYDANGKPLGPPRTDAEVQAEISRISAQCPFGITYKIQECNGAKVVDYVFADEMPDPRNIARATRMLELYNQLSRTLPEANIKAATATSQWKNSDWYNLGIEAIVAASKVLQNFNFVPESQKPVAEKLAELRALTRSVAEWIARVPSVHDSYFVGDRTVTHDELANAIEESPNLFQCEVTWGCFWQEKPEAAAALYRELMNSPVFCYVHRFFWLRDLPAPRLIAWNETDRQRIPTVWNSFVQELNTSTNVLWQLEARAIALADADNDVKLAEAFTDFFNRMMESRDALVANKVEVLYLNWGTGDLVRAKTSNGITSDTRELLEHRFYSEYYPRLNAMDQEYWNTTVPAGQLASAFQSQKKYLQENKPYNFSEFVRLFQSRDYSQGQAREIQPLVAAYKSNLVAQSQSASGMLKGQLMGAISQVGFLADDVNRILNPPAPAALAPRRVVVIPAPAAAPPPASVPETVTNVVPVTQFYAMPLDGLFSLDRFERLEAPRAVITAHHWADRKLVLDFQYDAAITVYDTKGIRQYSRQEGGTAIATFDPASKQWEVIACPTADIQSQNFFYHQTALVKGELFRCNGGQISKYDRARRQWRGLSVSDGNHHELFTVDDRLYAANQNTIFEILDDGKATRILASNRRQPPQSALDTENFGTPTLFAGPDHSLRVSTKDKIFTWNGNDWREVCAAPPATFPAAIFEDGVLFITDGFNQPGCVSRLATESRQAEFCLGQGRQGMNAGPSASVGSSRPIWKLPPELYLPNLPAATRQSALYLLVDHSEAQDAVNQQLHVITGKKILPRDGYHATLLCFLRDLSAPQKVFLRFDVPDACPPVAGLNPASRPLLAALPPSWLLFTTNFLFCGLENSAFPIPNTTLNLIAAVYKPGVWLLPLEQIEAAITAQKQAQSAGLAREKTQTEQTRKALLVKYDSNHSGRVDSEERETALADAAFIETELENIDTDHNGWVDATELAWFDANGNKILEPKEQTGIELAQHTFAARLMARFDGNGDGRLDQSEFGDMNASAFPPANTGSARLRPPVPDNNHDGYIDPAELEIFLKQQTRQGLNLAGPAWAAILNRFRSRPGQSADAQQLFKASVEFYWQNPGGALGPSAP
jgi:hypothetical protein